MNEITASMLDRSAARGASGAEVMIKTGSTGMVKQDSGGRIASLRTTEAGVALRVLAGDGRAGFASACGPHMDEAMEERIVEAALAGVDGGEPGLELPGDAVGDGRGLGIFDRRLHTATPSDLEGLLGEAVSEALRADPRVRRIESASIAASSSRVWIANTAGLSGSYRQTLVHLSLGVAADDAGRRAVVRRSRTARTLAGFSPALFADETARLATTALEGKRGPVGLMPALLAPAATVEILRLIAATLDLSGPARGSTIGSRLLNIIDDGRLPGGVASAPFDGEGVTTRRTRIVSHGSREEMIHDLASAARHGVRSTGNGVRASFREAPRRAHTNLFITPGSRTPNEMIGDLSDGVWIQSLTPTPDAMKDDRTIIALATGRRVTDGSPSEAFSGASLSCDLSDLLSGIVAVGNDLAFGLSGRFGAPSVLIGGLKLGGS